MRQKRSFDRRNRSWSRAAGCRHRTTNQFSASAHQLLELSDGGFVGRGEQTVRREARGDASRLIGGRPCIVEVERKPHEDGRKVVTRLSADGVDRDEITGDLQRLVEVGVRRGLRFQIDLRTG